MMLPFRGRRLLDTLLLAMFAASMAVMAVANEDPILRDIVCSKIEWACARSQHYKAWNKIFYDVSLASFVSLVFYFLIVRLPELSKRRRLKRSFRAVYRSFKAECTAIFLLVADGSYQSGLPEELYPQTAFKEYFGADRWNQFANKLEGHYLQLLLHEMETFREEVLYVLNNIDFDGDEDIAFLKRLSAAIASTRVITPGYDNKAFFRFLWSLFAGYDLATGYRQTDIVEDMIKRI